VNVGGARACARRTWRRVAASWTKTVAVATADPCVNRVLGVHMAINLSSVLAGISRPCKPLKSLVLSQFKHNPQSTIHNPYSFQPDLYTNRQHIPRITANLSSNQQSPPPPCRLHTDTTQDCKTPRSHLSAAVLNEGTVAVVAMAQSHLQAASRSAPD
jgi:hypothetical protein